MYSQGVMLQSFQDAYASLDKRYPSHTKILRFLISGSIATSADLIFLYIFTDIFGIWYLASSFLAFIIASIVSFLLQKFWTFRDHSRADMPVQAGMYLIIATCNLGLNTFLIYMFVERVGFYYLIAQIIVSVFIAIENFFIYQRLIFRTSAV